MPPRAMWTGQLRLSLVTIGVRLYAATESAKRVSMNQLHKGCHQRVKNQLVCPVHGPISRDEIEKGYEYEKDSYVIIGQEELESIRLPSSKAIDLVQVVDPDEIDPRYFNSPYYLGPDGPVAEESFRVIREAMSKEKKAAIGKFTLHGREHIVAIQVSGKGFLMMTLRYAEEVRSGEQYFADIKNGKVDDEQVKLARSIMDSKAAEFDPEQFHDRYRDAFFELVKAKVEGETPVYVEEEEAPASFNFMDALKQSVEQAGAGRKKKTKKKAATKKKAGTRKKPPAKSVAAGKKKKKRKTG